MPKTLDELDGLTTQTIDPYLCFQLYQRFRRELYNHNSSNLEKNKLLSDSQYGYRRNRSTELAAALPLDDIRKNVDKGKHGWRSLRRLK